MTRSEWSCSRCSSFGSSDPGCNPPRCECDEVEDDLRERLKSATALLAKVVLGGNPTGVEWQRINELIREVK